MTRTALVDTLRAFVGTDTIVTLDPETRPTALRFHRHDRLSDCLVREAIDRARKMFPEEMSVVTDVFVDFRDGLGDTRRRVEV